MDENTIGRVAKGIEGNDPTKHIEPTFKVEKVKPVEEQNVEHSTENPNETPKNIHPFLGHNFDKKV